MNRRELRQQTPSTIEYLNTNPTLSGTIKDSESSITLLRRLAHQSESAIARCQIAEIEAADVRQKYAGKHAPRANRTKLSEAQVVDNVEVARLEKEDAAKEEEKLRNPKQRLPGPKRMPIRLPKEALDRILGGVGGVGGVGGLLRQRYGLEINYVLSLTDRPAAVSYHCRF